MGIEESQKQRLNMRTVIIGISHDDDFAVMNVLYLEIAVVAGTDGIYHRRYFLVAHQDGDVIDFGRVLWFSS